MRRGPSVGVVVSAVIAALGVAGCGPVPAQTTRVSVSTSGVQGNQGSFSPSISGNGRYVAYLSNATNLVNGDTNGVTDVFIRDRQQNTTQRVMGMGQVQPNGGSGDIPEDYGTTFAPMIGDDGRFVVFHSRARNLIAGQVGTGAAALYVKDRTTGTVRKIVDGVPRFGISADGRWVAYWTDETEFSLYDAVNNAWRHRTYDGGCDWSYTYSYDHGTGDYDEQYYCDRKAIHATPQVTPNGQQVAFLTAGGQLGLWNTVTNSVQIPPMPPVEGYDEGPDSLGNLRMASDGSQVYVDRYEESGGGGAGGGGTWFEPVGTWSDDLRTGATARLPEPVTLPPLLRPQWSADNKIEAFRSFEKNLVANDTNNVQDIFVRVSP